jgi:phage gp36-like protein
MTNALVTIDDLLVRIGERELYQLAGSGNLNDDDGRILDETRLVEEISFASQLISGYLGARYPAIATLDVAAQPDLIKGYAADIVRYRLRARSGDRNTVTEEVRKRYEDAVSWLKDVARGRANADLVELRDQAQASSQTGDVRSHMPAARSPGILDGWQ